MSELPIFPYEYCWCLLQALGCPTMALWKQLHECQSASL